MKATVVFPELGNEYEINVNGDLHRTATVLEALEYIWYEERLRVPDPALLQVCTNHGQLTLKTQIGTHSRIYVFGLFPPQWQESTSRRIVLFLNPNEVEAGRLANTINIPDFYATRVGSNEETVIVVTYGGLIYVAAPHGLLWGVTWLPKLDFVRFWNLFPEEALAHGRMNRLLEGFQIFSLRLMEESQLEYQVPTWQMTEAELFANVFPGLGFLLEEQAEG